MMGGLRGFACCALLVAGAAGNACAAAPPALYSAPQAADGKVVFVQNCAACHGNDLKGGIGPALVGQAFSAPYNKNTIGSIFRFLSTRMPFNAAGSLSHTQYEDVMAFLLSRNGYPAGAAGLNFSAASASTIPLVSQVK